MKFEFEDGKIIEASCPDMASKQYFKYYENNISILEDEQKLETKATCEGVEYSMWTCVEPCCELECEQVRRYYGISND